MADKKNKEKKHFFKGLKSELKKVIWPTSKQITNNTIAVVTLVIVITLIVLFLDICLEKVNDSVLTRLRTKYTKTQVIDTENTSSNNDETTTNQNNTVNESTDNSSQDVPEDDNVIVE